MCFYGNEWIKGINPWRSKIQAWPKPTNLKNTSTSTSDKSSKRNVFTLFNALNFVIALALVAVQAWAIWSFAVICFNALSFGIATELRAKRMTINWTDRGELVTVIRAGEEETIDPEEIVLGAPD